MSTGGKRARPDFELLLDWAEGRLDRAAAESVAADIAADEHVREQSEWIRTFLRMSRHTVLADPPAEIRELLVRQFVARRTAMESPGPVARLRAALSFDSFLQPALGGARTAELAGGERHLVYVSPIADVAIDVYPAGQGTVRAIGQILAPPDSASDAATVRLLRDGAETAAVLADEFGDFTLPVLPAGSYELMVGVGPDELTIAVELWIAGQ